MIEETNNPDFKNKRNKTDVSLIAERIKATESLKSANNQAHIKTDQILDHERAVADTKTKNSRREHDHHRDTPRTPYTVQNKHHRDKERDAVDEATKEERAQADRALDKERRLADSLVTHVLDQERRATDKNLSEERATADTHFKGASATLESEIAEHTKTKSTLTSREELLAIVSHDLRNPVGTASSYATLILDMEGLDDEVRSFVGTIKRNTDTALRLIADLMDMERFAHQKWQFKFEACSGEGLIQQSLQNFSIEAKEKGIRLVNAVTPPLGSFNCDHDRLMQVFSNLIGNALRFTPRDGIITVDGSTTEDEIVFSVRDTGPGIPEALKTQIFERFVQLKSKNRTGLGLGLYISKTLIEALGGRIWVESEKAKGSAFFFTLPLNSKLPRATGPAT